MTRKVVKSIFMPKIYGKTYKTTRDDIANKIENELKDEDCFTVAKLCFDFWKDKYGHFEHFIKLLQNIDRRHPKIEHNDLLIVREEIAAASKTEDEKKTKKRRKESQILLSQEDLKKYDRECLGFGLVTLCSGENGSLAQVLTRNILRNDGNLVQCREGDNVLGSGDLRRDGYGNPPQMDREYKGDPNLLKPVIREYRPNDIGNERRSGGTCGTTYWITLVWHEAADAESAPMPLAMPCLVPRYGGGSQRGTTHPYSQQGGWHYWQRPSGENAAGANRGRPAPREYREEREPGRTDRPGFSRALAGSGVPVKGASAYPGVIITTCTSNLGTVERVTRLLFHSTTFVPVIHSLTERSSEGQPAYIASGEDGTTGKNRLAKTPQAVEEPGEAGLFDGNGRLWTMNLLKKALWSKGKCMNSWKKRERAYIKNGIKQIQ
nr:NADH dehydrogenase [ubiquinone] iron-sulfur protein 2 [Tanacetum cinerariifolium]